MNIPFKHITILHFVCFFVFATSVAASTNVYKKERDAKHYRIACSIYPIYQLTREVTQGLPNLEVICIASESTACPHNAQFTPGELRRAMSSNALIVNGLGLDDNILSLAKKLKIQASIINASDGLDRADLINDHNHAAKDSHAGEENVNPHIWASLELAPKIVVHLARQLATLMPEHKARLESNAENFEARAHELNETIKQTLANSEQDGWIAMHESLDYFARDHGLSINVTILSHDESEPTPRKLVHILKKIERMGEAILLTEPQYSDRLIQLIARETQIKWITLDPVSSRQSGDKSFLETWHGNLEALNKLIE